MASARSRRGKELDRRVQAGGQPQGRPEAERLPCVRRSPRGDPCSRDDVAALSLWGTALTANETAYLFVLGETAAADFEAWLHSASHLERDWGPERYLALLELDYRLPIIRHEAVKLVLDALGPAIFETWRLKRLLEAVVARGPSGRAALGALYDEYCRGYDFLDNLALGIGIEVRLTKHDAGAVVGPVSDLAVSEAVLAIRWLDDGVVEPLGTTDRDGRWRSNDHRSPDEKRPRTYQRYDIDDHQ